ncbi:outer membrane protein assembly factor BamA, partial [Fulvivirga sp. RKSG066]|uniref:BamA/OMP85 family outer membrane protein n=1 Tax=Fulvivirga aurantia TaxID=2529383 RepID=UPI0012BC3094
MRRVLIFLILCCFAGQVDAQFRKRNQSRSDNSSDLNYSNPTEYVIAAIEVSGLKVLDKNALISLSGLKVGDKVKVPGDDISGAIKKLWKHGLVGDVTISIDKIEGDQIYLNIGLAERPRLTGFTFEGVKKSRETEIREDLNLIRGRILSDAIIRNTQLTVKNNYVQKGFLNADVKVIQEEDTLNTDGVRLKIKVEPKAKVKIHRIRIIGNDEFSDSKVKKKMKKTNERLRFSLFRRAAELVVGFTPKKAADFMTESYDVSGEEFKQFLTDNIKLNFFKSQKFIQSEYEADKEAIIAFYNSKGFRDAEIVGDSIYAHSENAINIDIKVAEGRKYYFRDIIWTGNFIHTDNTLNSILNIEKGDVYNKELIDQKLTFNPKGPDISGLYMDDGYLFFQVQPVEVAVEGDSIDVEMRIREGSQATIKNIMIAGNDRTRDHVIRRELLTIPGRKFSRSDIITTNQRLAQLGYFDPEQISPNVMPNPADESVDIEWSVVERSSDQIELSGGWGGSFGFVGTLGLVLNNFSVRNMLKGKFTPIPVGDGQKLSLRAQANGRQFQSYSFSFTEPWLGGKKPNSLSLSYNYSIQRQTVPEFNSDGEQVTGLRFDDYNAKLSLRGVTVGLGRRLNWPDNYFSLLNSVSYTVYELENYGTRGLGFSDGNANSITFNTTLSRNSIDNPMYPTSGSSISLNISLTPPYSIFKDDNFWKLSQAERNDARRFIDEIRYPGASQEFRDTQYQSELTNRENSERYKWIEYHKWMFDANYYLKIVGKLVLETRAHFGFIGSYSDNLGVGPFERFQLGGDGLAGQNFLLGTEVIGLRGYENNSITPVDDNQTRGGIVYNKFAMELRYPVTTGQAATIYGFVFGEAGNNWNNYDEFNPFNNFRSAGFGARIFMPAFGLIGVNWGYGFDKLPGAKEVSGAQF